MNFFAIISLLVASCCLTLAIFIFWKANLKVHRLWAYFNIAVFAWSIGLFLVASSNTTAQAEFDWRLTYSFGAIVTSVFYHFVHCFCELKNKNILRGIYVAAVGSSLTCLFVPDFINKTDLMFNSIYILRATPLFNVLMIYIGCVVFLSFGQLLKYFRTAELNKRIQTSYVLYGFGIGWGGAITTFLPSYGLQIYPCWHFTICVYAVLMTYAIFKHSFLDIQFLFARLLVPALIAGAALVTFCYFYLHLNMFSMAGLSLGVACLLLAFLVFGYSRQVMHKIWALFNIVVGIWGLGTFFVGISKTYEQSQMSWKFSYSGGILIAVLFYHVVCSFCKLDRRHTIRFAYIQGFIFVLLNLTTNLFIGHLDFLFGSFYYNKATALYLLWFLIWSLFVLFAFIELFKFIIRTKGLQQTQALYLFWGMLLGFAGGTSTVAPSFGILVYPAWHFTICIYAAISTYAIFRYKIMDISIAVTRVAIFAVVYSLVLGIPIWIGLKMFGVGQWLIPVCIMAVFATVGPFIYIFLQRRAEELIQKEEKTMLEILKKASREIPHIKDLQHLFQFLTHNLQKLSIDHIDFYLWDVDRRSFIIKESTPNNTTSRTLANDDALILKLNQKNGNNRPLNYDEVQFLAKEDKKSEYQILLPKMEQLSAQVIIPMVAEGALVGFIVLGKRSENKLYSEELMEVLASIGTLAGSSTADYFYYEKLSIQERRASLDHLTESIAHDLDNPAMVVRLHGVQVKKFANDPSNLMSNVYKEKIIKSADYIIEASSRISKMVQDVKEYSKGTSGQKVPIKINAVEESFWNLMGYTFKTAGIEQKIEYIRDVEPDLPYILGDKSKLEQVLANFANNALYAVRKRNGDVKQIKLRIFKKNDDYIRLEYSDTGCGVKPDMINDIWLAHVTTKGSVEGTGMGLFIIRKIIEEHGGKAWAESEGENKGTVMIVEIPIFKGDMSQYIKEESQKGPKSMLKG